MDGARVIKMNSGTRRGRRQGALLFGTFLLGTQEKGTCHQAKPALKMTINSK
ncbi:MAG: hypothetical protein ACE1ZG_00830 [Gammaproteobacteria bacterium]